MSRIETSQKEEHCIIIGASHAGTTLALQLRREGWTGPITLVGSETELPYHRPPLSKEYLAGDKELDAMRLRPLKLYADNNIDLRLGAAVQSLDTGAQCIRLAGGENLNYDKLALCTGGHARRLNPAPDADSVYYIRTAADVEPLRARLQPGLSVAVIGGGYIGLEAAAVMAQKGLQVTVIEIEPSPLARVAGQELADFIQALHEARGVRIICGQRARDISRQGEKTQIQLGNGEALSVDLLVVGIGIEPNTELAAAAGLELSGGILVNQFTQTSVDNIFAAGDCCAFFSQLYERPIRLESVQNANDQARAAAANINGRALAYDPVPWFWSDQYDIKLQMAGLSNDHDEVVVRGDPGVTDASRAGGFVFFYLKAGRLVAADCINRPKEFMASKQLIQARAHPDAAALADQSVILSGLVKSLAKGAAGGD